MREKPRIKLLLVEDDAHLGASIVHALPLSDYDPYWEKDGLKAKRTIFTQEFDLIILDLGLPNLDGLSLLKMIREHSLICPVLILTARESVSDRIAGLDLGADDYITKPFDVEELKARIRASVRRASGIVPTNIRFKKIFIDISKNRVEFNDQPINLPRREFSLLVYLLSNIGKVATKERLEQIIYSDGVALSSNAVEVHIHQLRKKFYPALIKTIRGVGYIVEQ